MMKNTTLPRGLRNNNPLNIIKSKNQVWLGQTNLDGETTFCHFSTMTYGLRAALKLLRTYYQRHGCVTLRQIIRRWAPETENKTAAYIQTVSRMTGWHPDAPLPPMKQETQVVWHDIVLAMATVECGLDQQGRDHLTPYLENAWSLL